ncbi:hypothetical protein DAPPUDRAFT_271725 [Daphnia pulex]|uniref:Uncharacterized protein n=1 Tax=Daphnia pulex TaxID=6669 RepID=E9I2F8_DAPPU|nr:hypothetical protein DAPPUDRAFT_271725 [Daphnia pulex]|eukprot:EFX61822.1 hypothetical protein DAPPUDRAFT_271725 [Daphnia pulex]
MEISAGHLVPAENFCQSSRTSRKLLPANSYQPEDNASHLVPAGTVLYRQMPPRTTISYWHEMVEKMSTRIFGYEMSGTPSIFFNIIRRSSRSLRHKSVDDFFE